MRWTSVEFVYKDESIAIDIFPQLNCFLDFSRAVTPFCKNKVRKNKTQVGIAFVVNLWCSDLNKF